MSEIVQEWSAPIGGIQELRAPDGGNIYHFLNFRFTGIPDGLLASSYAYLLYLRPFNTYQIADVQKLGPAGFRMATGFEDQIPGVHYAIFRDRNFENATSDLDISIDLRVVLGSKTSTRPDVISRETALARIIRIIQESLANPIPLTITEVDQFISKRPTSHILTPLADLGAALGRQTT